MKKITRFLFCVCMLGSLALNAMPTPKAKKTSRLYVSQFENVLGTSLELKVHAYSEKQASVAENAALSEIERMSKILSGYDVNSEFSKWMKTSQQAIPVSKELFEVLSLFEQWKLKSGGALDASAQVIGQLWKQAAAKQVIPSQEEINRAVTEVQQTHYVLDATTQTATHTSNVPLMLNSFAKSYIIKHAADAAMSVTDVNAVVVNIGGDIIIAGNQSEKINVSDPKADAENDAPIDRLLLNNKAVATSGNYRRGELINGKWYSHIIDPRTGLPAGEVISATVVAPSATDAGALATAFNVLSVEESKQLASTVPGAEYMMITKNGDRITSKGWSAIEIAETKKTKPAASITADQWNPDYELTVNVELAQLQGFGRRPFVAVWVEDADKKSVRTIAVWFNKDRWLHELRAWYSANYSNFTTGTGNMASISSATRSAGKYSLKWDGKDDKGLYVKPGKYTIYIEAAREHGTYQLMSQEMSFKGNAQQATIAGNVEVASVSLEYKKKSDN